MRRREPAAGVCRAGFVLAILPLAGCAAFLGGDEARLALATDEVVLPLQFDDGVPLIDVHLGTDAAATKGPFLFKIDTGSGPSVIAESLAARLKLPVRKVSGTLTGANGKTRAIDRVAEIATLRLGDGVTLSGARAVVLPADDLDVHDARRAVEGILGFSAFTDCTFAIDYARGTLTLSRTLLEDGADVLPMPLVARTPRVRLVVGGAPLDALIDTGNDQGLVVPDEVGASMRFLATPAAGPMLSTVSGMTRVRVGRLDGDLEVGRHRVRRPLISLMPCNGAMLGAELLRHFAITLCARSGRARFVRRDDRPVAVESRLTDGLGLRRQGRGWQVVDVIPGSPAAAAGIRVGDAVRAVEYTGEGQFRIEVGQHGVFREVRLQASVMVK